MKKVLFVINTLGRGGAEVALLELLRCLSKEKIELSLYVLTGQGELADQLPEGVCLLNKKYSPCSVLTQEGKKKLAKTSLKALFCRGNGIRLLPHMVKQLFCMLKRGKIMPDKLLWRVLSDGGQRFDAEFDLAVAYIEGGATYYVKDHVNAGKKVAFFHTDYGMAGYSRSLDKECYLTYDKIFPVSDESKEAFLKVYPECADKTEVFHNLINAERIKKLANEAGGFTDIYDGFRILTVGRLTAPKDFAQSVQAMKLLKDNGIKARWYILGEGEERAALTKQIAGLGLKEDFFLLGVTNNPYAYMKQADIYVHATRYEGKSIAIQEAKILGCAILVSDCSGNKGQVRHKEDGLVCEMTPQAIYQGVMDLLSDKDKRRQYGEEATKSMEAQGSHLDKLLNML